MERFWSKVDKRDPDECWPWTGACSHGYGRLIRNGVRMYVHRFVYELRIGPIPEGFTVDHTCHNDTDCPGGSMCTHRRCCNPAHLEAVTNAENIRRGKAGTYVRATHKTHCVHGHEYTPANTYWDGKRRKCATCAKARERERYRQLTLRRG